MAMAVDNPASTFHLILCQRSRCAASSLVKPLRLDFLNDITLAAHFRTRSVLRHPEITPGPLPNATQYLALSLP